MHTDDVETAKGANGCKNMNRAPSGLMRLYHFKVYRISTSYSSDLSVCGVWIPRFFLRCFVDCYTLYRTRPYKPSPSW